MDAMQDDDIDEAALDGAQLKDLMEWAAKGSTQDMRERYGKGAPAEEEAAEGEDADPAAAEDADIPGVEADPEAEGAEGGGLDLEKLKAVLASLKGG